MRYLVTGKQAAEIDRHTIEDIGMPQPVLMERAALAVAEKAAELITHKAHEGILVVAEGGNNGGDGVAAARILHQRGYRAEVWLLKGIARTSEAYRKQVELAEKAGVSFVSPRETGEAAAEELLREYRVIVDAIFGVGLTREVTGVQKAAVDAVNRVKEEQPEMSVLSVDIPSGVSSETGEILGAAVKADHTVTFGFEKVGMRFAKDLCGEVTVPEIGFFLPEEHEPFFFGYDRQDLGCLLPRRSTDGNKGSFGHVLVAAGSEDMSGAAYFAAEAAYRTGCGLVKVVTHESNRQILQQMLPEALLKCYGKETDCADSAGGRILTEADLGWADAVIIGPGLGQSSAALELTEFILRHAGCPVIADADAVNLLAEHTEILRETAGKRPLILTPHMLEMTRLAEKTLHPDREAVNRLKKDRIRIAERTAEEYGATLVLKDACTLVTDGDYPEDDREADGRKTRRHAECPGRGYLNTSGNDAMAKGGSGDVLTGIIAGLIAQGLTAPEAARLGVYIHGLAGDDARQELGAYSVIAGDLIAHISGAMSGRERHS